MVRYSLPSNPNFTITLAPGSVSFIMTFKSIKGLMYVSIFDSFGARISGPMRICEGEWLIPHGAYNYEGAGNFMVVEMSRQYPEFQNFDSTCELRYYTKEEILSGAYVNE